MKLTESGVVRVSAVLVGLALIGSLVGMLVGALLLGLNPIGQTLASGLALCGGLWALGLLLGMVFTSRGSLGEYFWLYAPVVTAGALAVWLTAQPDTDPIRVIAFAMPGSLGLYTLSFITHVLIRKLSALRRTETSQ